MEAVRRELGRYLAGRLSLRALYYWLMESTAEVNPYAAPHLWALASDIKTRIFEHRDGFYDEGQLRKSLLLFVTEIEIVKASSETARTASASVEPALRLTQVRWKVAAREPETALCK